MNSLEKRVLIAWQDEKGNLLLGEYVSESERFYTVSFISMTAKRRNTKRPPHGLVFLVHKEIAQIQNKIAW